MGSLIFWCIDTVMSLYSLALLVYVLLSWLHPIRNKWTELLRAVVEVLLTPVRRLVTQYLPKRWQVLDWSPVAVWLLLGVVRSMLKWLLL